MEGGLFDLGHGYGFGALARYVGAGDLKAVEEEACASGVDGVGGDGLEDLPDGLLDGGTVFGDGEVEGVLVGARGCDGFAGGVVVVAEVFAAERWAAAAAAFGEDVTALVAFGLWHEVLPLVYF